MPAYRIPIELDLRGVPSRATELLIEADLPLLAAHAGCESVLDLQTIRVTLPDGRTLQSQLVSDAATPGLAIAVPAEVAGLDGTVLKVLVGARQGEPGPRSPRVVFNQGPAAVDIRLDGASFATYRYNTRDPELPRPYFHPIIGPTGVPVTQDGEFPGTKQGHIWHTGLVLAHQNFTNGNNWQTGGPQFSRMRHVAFEVMESGPVLGRFIQHLEWLTTAGDRVVFREARTVTVPFREPARRCIDVDTTITCGGQPATWNATPYHLLALRVPDAMRVGSGGAMTSSEGQTNPSDGSPAKWLDYTGALGAACGVAILDHPGNPRHPTRWLNFENETFGAAPMHREAYAWKPGEALRFRYRVYLHAGDVTQGGVAAEFAAFSAAPRTRIGPPERVA